MKMSLVKKMVCVLTLICLMAALAGCSSNASVDPEKLADDIYSGITWDDQIGEVSLEKALSVYGIDSSLITAGKVYMSTNATAEEIAVLEAASEDDMTTIESAIRTRISNQSSSFSSYNPDEVSRLNNAVVITKGNYIIMVVTNDASTAKEIVNKAFK